MAVLIPDEKYLFWLNWIFFLAFISDQMHHLAIIPRPFYILVPTSQCGCKNNLVKIILPFWIAFRSKFAASKLQKFLLHGSFYIKYQVRSLLQQCEQIFKELTVARREECTCVCVCVWTCVFVCVLERERERERERESERSSWGGRVKHLNKYFIPFLWRVSSSVEKLMRDAT